MTETANKRAKTSNVKECRACLAKLYDNSCGVDLFRAWDPPWSGMGLSIAEDLAKLANIQISVSDSYSRHICKECCNRLLDAMNFTRSVQNSDIVLRKRYKDCAKTLTWPKPIQVDKNIASTTLNEMNVEVKQEMLSEDEYDMNETYSEHSEPRLDIKIEPEEITPAPPSIEVEINGPFSLAQAAEAKPKMNGASEYFDECFHDVKEEPMSDDETGVPMDCMLCLKTFNTVKGLKAHVIAVHSYNTITSPRVDRTNVCTTCNRSFATRTDLFVHETCHSKFACYVCDQKFDSFLLLTKHRTKQCMKTSILPRLKTLDDVRRPFPVNDILDKTAQPTNSPPRTEVPEQLRSGSNSSTEDNVEQQQKLFSASDKTSGVADEEFPKWNEISQENIQLCEPTEKPSEEKRSENSSANEEKNSSLKKFGSDVDKLSEENIKERHESQQMTFVTLVSKAEGNKCEVIKKTEENTQKQESIDTTKDIVDSAVSKDTGININQVKKSLDISNINEESLAFKNNYKTEENISGVNDKTKENVSGVSNKPGENTTDVNKIDTSKVVLEIEEKRTGVMNETAVNISEDKKIKEKKFELCNESKENGSETDKIEQKTSVVNNLTNENVSKDEVEEKRSEACNEPKEKVQPISVETTCTNEDNLESEVNKTEEHIDSLETSASEMKAARSEQININEQRDEQNLSIENCDRFPKLQLINLKALSNPSEESMEIQLEIHSMDKEDDAMDIDNDLESEIKLGSSESDKTQ